MSHENDTDIQIALMPAPMDGPSADLKRKLRVAARETQPRALWWRSPLAGPLSLAGTVAAVVVVTTMLPAKASAKTYDLIVAAAQRVNAFQFSIVTDENSKHEVFTIAGSDGHVVMRTGESTVMEIDPGSMSMYDQTSNTVTRFKYGSLAAAEDIAKEVQSGLAEGMKEMDLKKMLREYEQKYGSGGIRISPVMRENGRGVYHVTLASQNQPERVEMTVDATTDLPERLQVFSKDGSRGWRTSVSMEMRFGARVDDRLLRSSIPKDAKVQTIDMGAMVGDAMKGLENLGDQFGNPPAPPKR